MAERIAGVRSNTDDGMSNFASSRAGSEITTALGALIV
jgi:hypothetical protein